jgi:hypothetical protein
MLIGFAIAGRITDAYKLAEGFDYKTIWLIPAGIAFAVLCIFALFFRNDRTKAVSEGDAAIGLAASPVS